jgi:hypothetical protein
MASRFDSFFYFITFLLVIFIFIQNEGFSKKNIDLLNGSKLNKLQILTLLIVNFFLFYCLLKSQNNL